MAEEKPVKEAQSLANFVKEDQGNAKRNVAIGLGGAAILTGAAILGSGAFRGGETQTTPPPSDKTAAAASPTPPDKVVVPTPTGSVEVTINPPIKSPEPTKSPESKVIDCEILPKELCEKGILITRGNTKYIAFKDIPVGTPLFSLLDGQRTIIDQIKDAPFKGSALLSFYTIDRSITYTLIGKVKIPDSPIIKKGEAVGSISQSSTKVFDEYDLILTATRRDSSGNPITDDNTLKSKFPKAFENPPLEYTLTPEGKIVLTNPNYVNKP